MDPTHNFVVAVSGPSGAGKTTLTRHLAAAFAPAAQLFYDHYYRSVAAWECNYGDWVAQGCDPNQFISVPRLVGDLRALRSGHPIISPRDEHIAAAPVIIFEEPWGRQRAEIASLIDYVVLIDVPLDMSFARRIVRDASRGYDTVAFARAYLDEPLRDIYTQMLKGAATADLLVDGLRPEADIVQVVVTSIRAILKQTI